MVRSESQCEALIAKVLRLAMHAFRAAGPRRQSGREPAAVGRVREPHAIGRTARYVADAAVGARRSPSQARQPLW
jgi:hypothetical protein